MPQTILICKVLRVNCGLICLSFFVSDTVLDRSKTYGGESSFADMLEVTCRGGEEDFAAAAVKIFRAKAFLPDFAEDILSHQI